MKIGLLITTYQRPEYLEKCLASVSDSDLSEVGAVLLMDDNSEDELTDKILRRYEKKYHWDCLSNYSNQGIAITLKHGCRHLIEEHGCDVIINLDGDALVKQNFIDKIISLYKKYPNDIITGFHSTTFNDNGSTRHRILENNEDHFVKESVGGINMCFSVNKHWRTLEMFLEGRNGNWDDNFCQRLSGTGYKIRCVKKSVIEHIGFLSSMNHKGRPDVANGFAPIVLPGVTLFGVCCPNALQLSSNNIDFHSTVMLDKFDSKAAYNKYILKNLCNHLTSSHVLVVQNDGYVTNWEAWDHSWLKYDYIGAPWLWYEDGMDVGNGGFSLRSRKLCNILSHDDKIIPVNDELIKNFEEDHNICRIYRKYLEDKYDIKFAPIQIAMRFSIEAFGASREQKIYRGQFGFHGKNVIWK